MKLVARGWLACLVAVWAGVSTAAENPHKVFADRGRCTECHEGVPRKDAPRAGLRLKKDIVALCLGCHRDKDVSALHPVDIRPGPQGPRDLPLDERGAITCATCHNVHGPFEADAPFVAEALSKRLLSVFQTKKKYRTFFLRRRNDNGQLCLGCHRKNSLALEGFHAPEASVIDQYVGSAACKGCHGALYSEWRKTPHARMVRDPKRDPSCLAADFDKGAPFSRDRVTYTLGSHWMQRFVVEKGGRLFVKGAVWLIPPKVWDVSASVDKPWAEYCQGCHTTGFEMGEGTPRFAELGVGCEACHGPGRLHVEARGRGAIVNPANLGERQRDMICESCHTTGHDRTGQFQFPAGYLPGKDLTKYFKGLLPKPGQDNSTFEGDESYEDRHRQWLFWVRSVLDVRDQNCDVCRNFRGKGGEAQEKPRMTPTEYCLSCHKDVGSSSGVHKRHAGAGLSCLQCHPPLLARGGHRYTVHDHKFLFLEPERRAGTPTDDACKKCHREGVAKVSKKGSRPQEVRPPVGRSKQAVDAGWR